MFLILRQLHENVSLSYTPILLLEPKHFLGYLFWKVIFFHEKVFDEILRWSFLSSMSSLRNFSELPVIKHIITKENRKTILLRNILS